jgi:GT2 family glycosyltransferase
VPTPARLAVVVCTYNRSASLVDTLGSLWADGYAGPAPIDVLVVANRCTDDTLARLGEFERRHSQDRLRLRWIEEPQPGKSHALNAAIAYTHHDALCFVDDDQIAEPGFFAALIRGLGDFPDDDMFCGRIWPAWDGSEPSWVHAKAPYAIPIRPFPEFDLGGSSRRLEAVERRPSGGNITVRRRVFDRVGGFSVALGPTGHNLAGGEDHEFLQRAVDAGFHIRYLPEVRQLHAIDAERTRASYILKKSYLRSRSSFLVDPPVSGPRMYMLRKIISHGLRAAAALDADRRFYLMVRTAASVGELMGAVEAGRRARTMGQANISSP